MSSETQYDDAFYARQINGSLRSGRKYATYIYSLLKPTSIADIGCGRGAWLKAFREAGATSTHGIDGEWNQEVNMLDSHMTYIQADLKNLNPSTEKYDLAISLEVAEHLPRNSADNFIRVLCSFSDAIMFSAAYLAQGGTNHLNEQPHTYWAKMFRANDFNVYDILRPVFWGDDEVEWWYRQNTFLYIRKGSDYNNLLTSIGHLPLADLSFMNCIHPALYRMKI